MKLLQYTLALLLIFNGYKSLAQTGQASETSHFEGTIIYGFELSGDKASMLQSFLPENMTFRFRSTDMAMNIEGGIMSNMGNIIYKGEKNEAFMIDKSAQKVYKLSSKSKDMKPQEPVVVKEAEIITIAGYPCQKYKVATRDKEGKAQISYLWATEKLQLKKPAQNSGVAQQLQSFTIKGVKGVPLKMMNTQANLGTVVLTATKVTPEKLPDVWFSIPAGFAVEEFDPMKAAFR